MDIIIPICIMILIFIICSICGYCCKQNKQGVVYGVANPPTVTTHTEYNISTAHPPNLGFVPQGTAPYPTSTPYPSQHTAPYPPAPGTVSHGYPSMPMPMPMPMPFTGGFSGNTPYPPMPMPGSGAYTAPVPPYPTHPGVGAGAAHQLPPSYAEAVTQPPPPTNELYAKQSPYNPNYN